MIRRSTIVLLLILGIVIGFAIYFNKSKAQQATVSLTTTPETQASYLFDATDGQPTNIRVESKTGEVVELARDAKIVWVVKQPLEAAAEQGAVEAAASQITAMAITDHLPNINPKDVGLDAPDYKLSVKFTNNVERITQIGVVTPTGNGYYVSSGNETVIVSKSAIDAIVGLLTNPPYAETLTPSPSPVTATDVPPLPSTPEVATATNETATPKP